MSRRTFLGSRWGLLLGVMLAVCACPWPAFGRVEAEGVTLVFRHDDYSSLGPREFDSGLLNLFQAQRIPATFAVVPFVSSGYAGDPGPQELVPLTAEKAAILKRAMDGSRIEVALHGYSHQTIHADKFSEFMGMPFEEQRDRIRRGREHLESLLDVKVTTFAPPWDSYDENTLRALEDEGFTVVTASLKGPADRSTKLKFVPGTTPIDKVRDAVAAARESGETNPVVVVGFHSFDFVQIDPERGRITMKVFEDLLGWLRAQEDVHLANLSEVASSRPDLDARLFEEKTPGLRLGNRLSPEPIGNLFPYYFLYPSPRAGAMIRARGWAVLSLIYLAALLASTGVAFIACRLLARRVVLLVNLARYGGIVALAALGFYVFRDADVYFRGAIALVVGSGLLAGTWLALLGERNEGSRA